MRNLRLENELCSAISKYRTIMFRYKNELFDRTFEPYIVYFSPTDKNFVLLGGTQTKDDSKPLQPAEPHKFEVELLSRLAFTDKTFDYDPRFDPTRPEYRNGIICVIKRTHVAE